MQEDRTLSINSHSTIREDNYERCCAETAKYGGHRVALSLHVVDILQKLNVEHGLDAGSLLGAHRSGTMLPHDDDFDIWFYANSLCDADEHMDKVLLLQLLMHRAKPYLDKDTHVRVVSSYCYKLEFYRPQFGKYAFRDTDYHNVTVDVTMILSIDHESGKLQYQHTGMQHRQHTLSNLLPTSVIEYEGHLYNAPASVAGYLAEMYEYIGPDAYFDIQEGIYKPKQTRSVTTS